MNFYALGALICAFRPHKFGKAKDAITEARNVRIKICKRCGLERQVQRRAKKVEAA